MFEKVASWDGETVEGEVPLPVGNWSARSNRRLPAENLRPPQPRRFPTGPPFVVGSFPPSAALCRLPQHRLHLVRLRRRCPWLPVAVVAPPSPSLRWPMVLPLRRWRCFHRPRPSLTSRMSRLRLACWFDARLSTRCEQGDGREMGQNSIHVWVQWPHARLPRDPPRRLVGWGGMRKAQPETINIPSAMARVQRGLVVSRRRCRRLPPSLTKFFSLSWRGRFRSYRRFAQRDAASRNIRLRWP